MRCWTVKGHEIGTAKWKNGEEINFLSANDMKVEKAGDGFCMVVSPPKGETTSPLRIYSVRKDLITRQSWEDYGKGIRRVGYCFVGIFRSVEIYVTTPMETEICDAEKHNAWRNRFICKCCGRESYRRKEETAVCVTCGKKQQYIPPDGIETGFYVPCPVCGHEACTKEKYSEDLFCNKCGHKVPYLAASFSCSPAIVLLALGIITREQFEALPHEKYNQAVGLNPEGWICHPGGGFHPTDLKDLVDRDEPVYVRWPYSPEKFGQLAVGSMNDGILAPFLWDVKKNGTIVFIRSCT